MASGTNRMTLSWKLDEPDLGNRERKRRPSRLACDRASPPGTDSLVDSIQMRAAGSAGNTALALAHLGHIPHLVGCVGDDHFGQFILQELATAGIDGGVAIVPDEPTGISIALEAPGA
jgi:sugar/nucleoside kinase (ribokinase family)